MGCFEMLLFLVMFVYVYPADGNHYLIETETSDNSKEAVSGMDYAEPGCIELRTRFSVSCAKEGYIKCYFFCSF